MEARPLKRPARWAALNACSAGGQEKRQRRTADKDAEQSTEAKGISEKGEKLKGELDELIEEIDEVLEENAEEFVRNYVQRGGQ